MTDAKQTTFLRVRASAVLTIGWRRGIGLLGLFVAAAIPSPAQDEQASLDVVTFTSLFSFDGIKGAAPLGALVQGTDGNLYGTTQNAGAYGSGTVFKITPSGSLTVLYSFCSQTNCIDGSAPQTGLVLGTEGNFYGTTCCGGANNNGTVFKVTPGGALATLYSFCSAANCSDGSQPNKLVLATDGNFYGTTFLGGTITCGCGTVFKISAQGVLTTLHSFNDTDGSYTLAPLVQATDGNFYGTAQTGGLYGLGTVFRITPTGLLTTLHSFCAQTNCIDGAVPDAGVIQAANGTFTGQPLTAALTVPSKILVAARYSKSPPRALSRPFTAFAPKRTALTAPIRSLPLCCKAATGTSTGRPRLAGRTIIVPAFSTHRVAEQSSESPRAVNDTA